MFSKTLLLRLGVLALSVSLLSTSVFSTGIISNADDVELNVKEDFEIDGNWARLLQHSIYFYDANMCGTEVDENNLYTWRHDCHTYDSQVPLVPMKDNIGTNLSQDFINEYSSVLDPDGDGFIDVSGGFHDAGDHVKFGMPENYAASTLGWGYYEFRDAYAETGQDEHIETILRYFNDYLMKCTFRDNNGTVIAHCYQVGDGDIDHAYWNSPEVDTMARPAFFLTADKPQTDYVVSAAASLAINYLNFKETDPEYAEKSLDYANALFEFANANPKELSDNTDGPKGYYRSEKWVDDYVWAAAWLFLCTEDISYLNACLEYIDYYAPAGWAHCWNDVWAGAITMLGVIDMNYPEIDLQNMYRNAQGKTQYEPADFWASIREAMVKWSTGYNTPGGYAYLNQWGSARYNTAMQLVCLVYDKYNGNTEYGDWAKGQMEYLMGENPINTCYFVGYCDNSAKFPHHRAASGLTKAEDTGDHKHVLYGALVGGPDGNDNHIDVTADYIYNEVTIDYNAAFVGAAAGLYYLYGDDSMAVDADFPPPDPSEMETDDTNVFGGDEYWVSAFCTDDMQSTGAGVTKITLYVYANASTPKTDISVRYYFDVSEFSNSSTLNSMTVTSTYDQVNVEVGNGMKGVLTTTPVKYDEDTYYVEISWPGYTIANSNKKYQMIIGLYYGDTWDTSNDWSHVGMVDVGKGNYDGINNAAEYVQRCDNFCVYSDGVLIGGVEPDGTKPDKIYSAESYLRLMQGVDNKKIFPGPNFAGQFDLNTDNYTNVVDAVALKRLVTKID